MYIFAQKQNAIIAKLQKISVLPKTARSTQTFENSPSFFDVSYTCYKSLIDGGLGGAFLALPNEYVLASIPHPNLTSFL